jgi:hypothetical protein
VDVEAVARVRRGVEHDKVGRSPARLLYRSAIPRPGGSFHLFTGERVHRLAQTDLHRCSGFEQDWDLRAGTLLHASARAAAKAVLKPSRAIVPLPAVSSSWVPSERTGACLELPQLQTQKPVQDSPLTSWRSRPVQGPGSPSYGCGAAEAETALPWCGSGGQDLQGRRAQGSRGSAQPGPEDAAGRRRPPPTASSLSSTTRGGKTFPRTWQRFARRVSVGPRTKGALPTGSGTDARSCLSGG